MARLIRQQLPEPPATYDQSYIAKLANAINQFMLQVTAQAEVVAASYICTAPVVVDPTGAIPGSVPTTKGLPNGTLYLYKTGQAPGAPVPPGTSGPGTYYVSIVTEND